MNTTPKRRWSFSLRTLFVVVTVFGCWLGYQLNWIRERRNAPILEGMSEVAVKTPSGLKFERLTREAPWPLGWLGERGRFSLWVEPSLGDKEVARIRRLFPEAKIEVLAPDATPNE